MIQDPAEAVFAGMPRYAASFDDVDYTVPVGQMGVLLTELATGTREPVVEDDLSADPSRTVTCAPKPPA